MGKTLIIAEKPSVATDLARALERPLGKFEKKGRNRDTYFANDRAVITSAVGHLVELKMPTTANGRKLPWKFDVLPAIPETFELEPREDGEPRLRQIIKLAKSREVDMIVNACDAGREGELIFRYIMEYGGIDKPIKRLWMQSMTRDSILQAWESLRSDDEMQALADAARCRSESDWLVGLNATRALTCFRSRHGGFNITAAGRVQTPTLAILATREEEIQTFRPRDYFEVVGSFEVAAGTYEGKWIDEGWRRNDEDPHDRAERIWERELAEAIRDRCDGRTAEIEEKRKSQRQGAPQLYDLTTLQREAPFSARQTLSIAQALYERHKMITYPRTDSRYLPADYIGQVRTTMGDVAGSDLPVAEFARTVLDGDSKDGPRLAKNPRVFDSKKVSDHFAIIPTGRIARLSDAESKIYDMIVRRFIAVFYPAAEFEVTQRLSRVRHGDGVVDTFRTDGRVLVKPGWLAVYGRRPGTGGGKDELVSVAPEETARLAGIEVRAEQTKPPARFTESTLLSAMEGAGKLLDDEALAEAMSERGLGTPATRAAIIEGLLSQKYIARDGEGGRAPLHVTPRGMRLIELLREMRADGLTSPSLTGEWEFKLRRMEQGALRREEFMREIEAYTREIVAKAKRHLDAAREKTFPDLDAPCPKCQAPSLRQTDGMYECRNPDCGFRISKYVATRELREDEARELIGKGFVGPLEGFKSRFNKPFEAALELDDAFKVQFVFDQDEPVRQDDLTEETRIGHVTLPDGRETDVHQTAKAYVLPGLKGDGKGVGLTIGRTILKREIEPAQVLKLLASGKTDLLKGFVSKRNRRSFAAYLVWKDDKITFEFEPRKPKAAAKKKADGTAPSDDRSA